MLLAPLLLLLGALSCGSEQVEARPSTAEQLADAYEEYNALLAQVVDVSSAEALQVELMAVVVEITELTKEAQASAGTEASVTAEAEAELTKRIKESALESVEHMRRLSEDPDAMGALLPVLQKWQLVLE